MAERIDLDAVPVRYDAAVWFNAAGPPETMRTVLASVQDVPAMVTELRELRARYGDDEEVWCGARRDQAGSAYCVEMAGHELHGYPHMWGRHDQAGMP